MFALTPPSGSGASTSGSRSARTATASAGLDQVAEPRACAMSLMKQEGRCTQACIMQSSDEQACCAWPFGAVRLTLRPSRTALPSNLLPCLASIGSPRLVVAPPHASPRAYPSARESNVCERPRADVMPAGDVAPTLGAASHHSRRSWHTRRAEARAVPHGTPRAPKSTPCRTTRWSVQTESMREAPAAIEDAEPVAAYTLPPAGDAPRMETKSEPEKPMKTRQAPLSTARPNAAPCGAAYPYVSSRRWDGSIAAASAAEMAKAATSASWAPHTKPP